MPPCRRSTSWIRKEQESLVRSRMKLQPMPKGVFMYYFAFGANMNEQILAERGVTFAKVATGRVQNLRLVFHKPGIDGTGKADLQDAHGAVTEGVVWEVPEASLAQLDVYEGVDKGHYRRGLLRVQTSKGELECAVYRASKFKTGLLPSRTYLDAIISGAEAHRLSASYLTFLRSHLTMESPAG